MTQVPSAASLEQARAHECGHQQRVLALEPQPHLLLLWAIEGSCGVQHSLLGIVEQLGDVLQVLG